MPLCIWRLLFLLLFVCSKACAMPVAALVFSPDDAALVAASGEQLQLRAPENGAALETISCAAMRVTTLAFSPSGTLLAVGGGVPGEKGELRLFDWPHRKWLGSVGVNHDIITSVAFSPDGERVATASADNTARIYRVEEQGARIIEQFVLNAHSAPVQVAAFSPDGKYLVTASIDRSIKVWSAANGALLRSLGQHTDGVHCIAFRPFVDGQPQCASAGDDCTVRIWQPAIGRMMRIVRRHEGAILAMAFAPDGRRLYSAGQEGIVRQIDADSDAVLNQWQVSSDWIHAIAIAHDGRRLATGDWAGRVTVQAIR